MSKNGNQHSEIFTEYYRELISKLGIDLPLLKTEIKECNKIGKNGIRFEVKLDDSNAIFFQMYDSINKIHYLCRKDDLKIKWTFKTKTSITLSRVKKNAILVSEYIHVIHFKLCELNGVMI